MTLSDAAKLKNEMLNVLEQKLNKASMFQEGGSNHNKHTNPDSPQPKRP